MIVSDGVLPKRVLGSTGKRTIHGMGGVGKTRASIESAWKHADDYRTLLFISADTSEALHRNLASLCGPLVLNLPEQNEKEQALQVEAALRWLKLHPGWFLIIDYMDTAEAAHIVCHANSEPGRHFNQGTHICA
jgi:hypothetical protein